MFVQYLQGFVEALRRLQCLLFQYAFYVVLSYLIQNSGGTLSEWLENMENKSRHNAETLMIELVLEERNACKMGSLLLAAP